eukprot:TRINITY_DN8841_c0_g2_i1.p3 TRINITY_DN8841_c0_g2~~TRINITY_DN8841_c0_g2_i1.p3  ORF type:complete len:260 (+),score=93.32 TRINITY_DN8841_c0_g2_i1:78-857(+)
MSDSDTPPLGSPTEGGIIEAVADAWAVAGAVRPCSREGSAPGVVDWIEVDPSCCFEDGLPQGRSRAMLRGIERRVREVERASAEARRRHSDAERQREITERERRQLDELAELRGRVLRLRRVEARQAEQAAAAGERFSCQRTAEEDARCEAEQRSRAEQAQREADQESARQAQRARDAQLVREAALRRARGLDPGEPQSCHDPPLARHLTEMAAEREAFLREQTEAARAAQALAAIEAARRAEEQELEALKQKLARIRR